MLPLQGKGRAFFSVVAFGFVRQFLVKGLIIKKAMMGGKLNIIPMLFLFFGGEGFGGIWGELGEKAVKGPYKAQKTPIFINVCNSPRKLLRSSGSGSGCFQGPGLSGLGLGGAIRDLYWTRLARIQGHSPNKLWTSSGTC